MTTQEESRPELAGKEVSSVLRLLENRIDALERLASAFQEAQAMLPLPSTKELAEMKTGARPVNRVVYLLWFLQRGFMALEEVANGVRVELEDGLAEVQIESFGAIQFNAVEQAIRCVLCEAGTLRAKE